MFFCLISSSLSFSLSNTLRALSNIWPILPLLFIVGILVLTLPLLVTHLSLYGVGPFITYTGIGLSVPVITIGIVFSLLNILFVLNDDNGSSLVLLDEVSPMRLTTSIIPPVIYISDRLIPTALPNISAANLSGDVTILNNDFVTLVSTLPTFLTIPKPKSIIILDDVNKKLPTTGTTLIKPLVKVDITEPTASPIPKATSPIPLPTPIIALDIPPNKPVNSLATPLSVSPIAGATIFKDSANILVVCVNKFKICPGNLITVKNVSLPIFKISPPTLYKVENIFPGILNNILPRLTIFSPTYLTLSITNLTEPKTFSLIASIGLYNILLNLPNKPILSLSALPLKSSSDTPC